MSKLFCQESLHLTNSYKVVLPKTWTFPPFSCHSVAIHNQGTNEWSGDAVKLSHNASRGPHKVFHPHVESYLHEAGGWAVKTEGSRSRTRSRNPAHTRATLSRYHGSLLIYSPRWNIWKWYTWRSTTHHGVGGEKWSLTSSCLVICSSVITADYSKQRDTQTC